MANDKLKLLEAARAKLAALEKAVAEETNRELAQLPSNYGFNSVGSFLKAVRAAARGGKKSASGKRRRALITDEIRTKVKKMVESGKTGGEIAETVGISLPSVQNIKKALGLVKKRP